MINNQNKTRKKKEKKKQEKKKKTFIERFIFYIINQSIISYRNILNHYIPKLFIKQKHIIYISNSNNNNNN